MAKIEVVDPKRPFKYAKSAVPSTYVCKTCKATNCKLWREYQAFLEHQQLYCCDCAAEDQGKDISTMTKDGTYSSDPDAPRVKIDQIGWLIPAVPTEANDTFWGYTSVPQPGVDWWKRLPLRDPAKKAV
jgi:hypothetical protein